MVCAPAGSFMSSSQGSAGSLAGLHDATNGTRGVLLSHAHFE